MCRSVKCNESPEAKKQVKFLEKPHLYKDTPKWSFVKCDMQHEKWGILSNSQYLAKMLERFKAWERVNWGEILTTTAGRKSNTQSHSMPVNILNKEAIDRLKELKLYEFDTLYSLAITGQQRIWGIMIEETGTFQLLWYDPKHEIYPVQKR